LISREDQIPAREARHNNNDDISTQPSPSDARLVAAKEFLFQRARCVSVMVRGVKLHPPVRKRLYADSPAPKVRKNRFRDLGAYGKEALSFILI
jgi:hypothetical protein